MRGFLEAIRALSLAFYRPPLGKCTASDGETSPRRALAVQTMTTAPAEIIRMRKQASTAFSRPGNSVRAFSPLGPGDRGRRRRAFASSRTHFLGPARAAAAAVGKCQQRRGVAGPYLFVLASHTIAAVRSPSCSGSCCFGTGYMATSGKGAWQLKFFENNRNQRVGSGVRMRQVSGTRSILRRVVQRGYITSCATSKPFHYGFRAGVHALSALRS